MHRRQKEIRDANKEVRTDQHYASGIWTESSLQQLEKLKNDFEKVKPRYRWDIEKPKV